MRARSLYLLLLAASPVRVLAQDPGAALPPGMTTDPEAARISYEDLDRFGRAHSRLAGAADTVAVLDSLYLGDASPGLAAYAEIYDVDAAALAEALGRHPAVYARVAADAPTEVRALESAVRDLLRRYREIYPPALFPTIWYLVGPRMAGGTVRQEGVLLAVETYTAPRGSTTARGHTIEDLVHLAAHELTHFQQAAFDVPGYQAGRSNLARAIREGTADFLAERLTGDHINRQAHDYGVDREWELWSEFRCGRDSTDTGEWFFVTPADGERPPDLGYFLGSGIARSYYRTHGEDDRALADIIRVRDWSRFLEESGYEEGLVRAEGRPFPACPAGAPEAAENGGGTE